MATSTVTLDGKIYKLAANSGNPTAPDGPRAWVLSQRPSQQGDPSISQIAEWRVDGPAFNSFEDVSETQPTGVLGTSYTDNCDTSNEGELRLGPAINTVDLSTYDTQTPIDANGADMMDGPSSKRFLYVIRGRNPAKVDISDMTLVNPGTVITLAENATSILATENTAGTKELSFGMKDTAYEVVSAVGAAGVADTHAANSASKKVRIIAQASDRVAGFNGAQAMGIILSGTTMGAPSTNWSDIATISGVPGIESTGFAQDGLLWIWGTSKGPYLLNTDTGEFEPMIDETGLNSENCRAMGRWSYLHAIIPTVTALRYQRNGDGASIGPEMFQRNLSPVQGFVTGFGSTTRGMFVSLYNFVSGHTYLLYGRPRRDGDYHNNAVSWFTMAKFASTRSDFLRDLGTDGGRDSPTLVGGYGSDLFWLTMGRTERWPDDTLYQYAGTGKWYGTELRRNASMLKDLEAVELFTEADSDGTITVGFTMDGVALHQLVGTLYADSGEAINSPITTVGPQRLLFVDDNNKPLSWAVGTFFSPQLDLVARSATSSSLVKGSLRVYYRARPRMTTMLDTTFVLDASNPGASAEEQATALLALHGTGPVALTDNKGVTDYWRVDNVQIGTIKAASGATADVNASDISIAALHLTRWPTGEGE